MSGADLPSKRGDREVDVWCAHLDLDPLAEREAWAVLSADERARASRLKRERDRVVTIRTRALLRHVLAGYLGVGGHEVKIGVGPEGKPEVVGSDGAGWPRFNVSHSDSVALIAVAGRNEVGVDVERVRADIAWQVVAHTFFSATEVAAIERVAPPHRRRAFFDCWVRKEAYLKGLGIGLRRPTDDFDVPLGKGSGVVLDSARDGAGPTTTWYVHHLGVGRDYAAALAVDGIVKVRMRRPRSSGRR